MAVAFVGATDLGNTAGTATWTVAYTCGSGANRLLVFCFMSASVDRVTTVTYGGAAMTLLDKGAQTAGGVINGRWCYFYYLLSPASGANNIVVSASASNDFFWGGAADYTGVPAAVDAHTSQISGGAVNTLTTSLTTVADNCWTILAELGYQGNNAPTAGTGSTLRVADGTFGTFGIFDSNGVIHPAGSYSMTTNRGAADSSIVHFMASFSPTAGGGGGSFKGRPYYDMVGLG